jgi:DNA-directed RNA polymerase subunit RPC12/RpoP
MTMKQSRLTRIGMVAVGVLLLAWIVLTLASGGETKTAPARSDGKTCPECGRPLPSSAQLEGVCPYCRMEKGPEAAKLDRGKKSLATSPVIPVVLVCLFLVLLSIHLGVTVRGRLGKAVEEELYYYRCPKCGRKLRYRTSQVGRSSQCPICRRPLTFPRPPEEPTPEPAYRALARRLLSLFSARSPRS